MMKRSLWYIWFHSHCQ